MRILYDARSVRTPAGIYVFRGLTSAWRDDGSVARVQVAVPQGFDLSVIPAGIEPIQHDGGSWFAHVQRALPRLADRLRVDIIFAPNGAAPRDSRSVLYFQDLFHFRARIDERLPVRGWVERLSRATWRAIAAPQSLLGVAVSTEILEEVRGQVNLRSVLIPNGVDVGGHRWLGDGNFVLVMGGIGVRKDEPTAIHAWSRLPRSVRDGLSLRIIGVEPVERRRSLQALAASLGLTQDVTVEGGMSRDDFLEGIARARLAISCSRLEAFGLPVAEALAIGTPLVCTNIPSHDELLRRASAGRTYESGSAADLARHIECVLSGDIPPRMTDEPARWTWHARAREHLDAYRKARSGVAPS
ncbi:MAG TPA: glycosyltransferase [Vicinamibacterales bacterium]|nr:glycosyltransferase [Vicinamibacterales bacterium]